MSTGANIHMKPEREGRVGAPKSFRELDVWQKAKTLAVAAYRFTDTLPKDEKFGLTQQIRRASIAVAANIAEGHGRDHLREKIQFYAVARSSAGEVEAEIEVALELGRGDQAVGIDGIKKADEVQRMLRGLQKSLAASEHSAVKAHTSYLTPQTSDA